jgi:hypothetical protein
LHVDDVGLRLYEWHESYADACLHSSYPMSVNIKSNQFNNQI